ncbi:MAG: NAD-dependent epimerase/dehydratase family protein [Gemmatimonadales bacterium]
MKVFVTGGTGLVGSHIIQQLIARGDTVLALARSQAATDQLLKSGAEPLAGDLTDPAALRRGIEAADVVIHSAAVVLSRGGWNRYHAVNVVPTETIARAAARAARRFVHVSSVAVYGRRTTYDGGASSVTEDFGLARPLFPGDHYARSKRESELALWKVCEEAGLEAVALRPCVIYGERDRTFAIRVARVLRRGVAMQIGDGTNRLSVVYAGNVAAAALLALDRPRVTGAFNVANDGDLTQRAFLERFAAGLGVRLRAIRVPKGLAWNGALVLDSIARLLRPSAPMATLKTAVQFLSASNPFVSARAERELGWKPVVSAEDAAERTGRWFRRTG